VNAHRLLAVLVALAVVVSWAGPASGQSDRPSREWTRAQSLSPAQKTALRTWAERQLERLNSDNRAEVQDGRLNLLAPFAGEDEVSIAFRLEFGRTLMSGLRALADGDDVQRSITASLIAGKCATQEMIGVLQRAAESPKAAHRSGAAEGLRQVVQQVGDGLVAPDVGSDALDVVAGMLRQESDQVVVSVAVRALRAAEGGPLHGEAADHVVGVFPGLVVRLADDASASEVPRLATMAFEAQQVVFRWLVDPAQGGNQPEAFLDECTVLSAHMLAAGLVLVNNPSPDVYFDTNDGWRIRTMMAGAEQMMNLVDYRINQEQSRNEMIKQSFEVSTRLGDDARLRETVEELLELGTNLTGADLTGLVE